MQQRRIRALKEKVAPSLCNNGDVANSSQSHVIGSTLVPTSLVLESLSTNPTDGISLPHDSRANEQNSSDDEPLDEDFGVLPGIGYTSESSGAEEGEVKDSRGRKRIRPTGRDSLEGCDGILRDAYSIMHCYYKGPWRKWSMVPKEYIDIWWEEFKKRFFWKDKHCTKLYRNWRAKCSEHLRSTFAEARRKKTGKRPDFIEPELWEEMLRGWEQDDTFKRQSEMNKRNRASKAPNGIGHFVGGAKPLVKIRAEYERKHGKKMSQEKLVEKAYKKSNGEWSSDKAPIVLEKYKDLCERFIESHPEGITQEVADALWLDAVGGTKKDSAFCLAALGRSDLKIKNSASSSYRASNSNVAGIEELRRTIEVELRKKIEDEVQKSMEERMQHLLMKQRQEDAIIYDRMLEMQRSRYALPTSHVDTVHSYAPPSFGHQQRYVEQLPASTHLFDASAFAAVRPSPDAYLTAGSAASEGRLGSQFSG